jgi:hypothetical protein
MRRRDVCVYSHQMSRKTQITLTDRQHRLLVDESIRSSVSMAELVRRAIDSTYRPSTRPIVRGYHMNVGLQRAIDPAMIGRYATVPRRVTD